MRCLAKRPADRPQTAAEVYGVLDTIGPANGDGVSSAEMARAPTPRRYSRSLVAAATAAFVLIAGWFSLHQRARVNTLNPRRFVVTPFRNLTGDSTLDVIGSLIAVGVATGLEQLDSITVVSSLTGVTDSTGRLRSLATIDPIAIGKETRAGRALAGSYSRQGDTLRLQAQIVDVNTGAVERTLDPVVGQLSAPNSAIERLRDNVVTALEASAARKAIGSIGHLPTLAAYREFANTAAMGLDGPQALPHLIRATQLDTTFTLALYWLGVSFVDRLQWKAADSDVQILSARRDSFTPVERDLFWSLDGFAHSDFGHDLAASRELFKRDSSAQAGGVAFLALCVNRPREALSVLGAVPEPREHWAYWNKMTLADHMLGNFREEMATATKGRAHLPSDPFTQAFMVDAQTRALAALGDVTSLRQKVDSSVAAWSHGPSNPMLVHFDAPDNPGETYEHVAAELFAHDRAADGHLVREGGDRLARCTSRLPTEATDAAQHSLAHLLMLARRLDSAQAIWARLAIRDTLYTDARIQLAIVAAWRGDTVQAQRTMRVVDSLATLQYSFGRPVVQEARIAAALGRKADAVGLLERAMSTGAPLRLEMAQGRRVSIAARLRSVSAVDCAERLTRPERARAIGVMQFVPRRNEVFHVGQVN